MCTKNSIKWRGAVWTMVRKNQGLNGPLSGGRMVGMDRFARSVWTRAALVHTTSCHWSIRPLILCNPGPYGHSSFYAILYLEHNSAWRVLGWIHSQHKGIGGQAPHNNLTFGPIGGILGHEVNETTSPHLISGLSFGPIVLTWGGFAPQTPPFGTWGEPI